MSILASASITLVRVDDGAKGDTGVGIASVDVYYYLSASSASLSGGSWSTTAPTWVDGKYVWSKTVTTNTNGTSTESGAVCITGQKGATGVQGPQGEIGETGTGIESIIEQYYLSTSKDSPPTDARGKYNITTTQNGDGTQTLSIIDAVDGGNYNITTTQNDDGTQTLSITTDDIWSEAPPTWSTGKYIWTRSKIVYKNPTSVVYTTPICDSSWEAVNEIKVGGRNLFSGYGEEEIRLNDYQNTGSFTQFIDCLTFSPCETVGETYTISFWAKSPNGSTPLAIYNDNKNPRHFYFPRTTLTYSLNDEWEYFTLNVTNTDRGEEYEDTYCNRIEIYAPNQLGVLVKKIKVERGNKATDWTPAPEDVHDDIVNVGSSAEDKLNETNNKIQTSLAELTEAMGVLSTSLGGRVDIVEKNLRQIVVDENGSTVMDQTGDGYSFNFYAAVSEFLGSSELMKQALAHQGKIFFEKDENGDPYIKLQPSDDSRIKLKLDVDSMSFLGKSDEIIGKIEADTEGRLGVSVDNETVTGEFRQSNQNEEHGEFVWQVRPNGNYGVSWKVIQGG